MLKSFCLFLSLYVIIWDLVSPTYLANRRRHRHRRRYYNDTARLHHGHLYDGDKLMYKYDAYNYLSFRDERTPLGYFVDPYIEYRPECIFLQTTTGNPCQVPPHCGDVYNQTLTKNWWFSDTELCFGTQTNKLSNDGLIIWWNIDPNRGTEFPYSKVINTSYILVQRLSNNIYYWYPSDVMTGLIQFDYVSKTYQFPYIITKEQQLCQHTYQDILTLQPIYIGPDYESSIDGHYFSPILYAIPLPTKQYHPNAQPQYLNYREYKMGETRAIVNGYLHSAITQAKLIDKQCQQIRSVIPTNYVLVYLLTFIQSVFSSFLWWIYSRVLEQPIAFLLHYAYVFSGVLVSVLFCYVWFRDWYISVTVAIVMHTFALLFTDPLNVE